jgi:hypothetical protein
VLSPVVANSRADTQTVRPVVRRRDARRTLGGYDADASECPHHREYLDDDTTGEFPWFREPPGAQIGGQIAGADCRGLI